MKFEAENKSKVLYRDADFYANINHMKYKRPIMSLVMICSDLLCLILSVWLVITIWRYVRTDFSFESYKSALFPTIGFFVLVYFLMGLYPGIGIGPVEELRRLTVGSFFIILGLITFSFYLGSTSAWSRAILGLSWLFITISLPLSRKIFRRLAVKLKIWGLPVAIIGNPASAKATYNKLRQRPLTGLWPVLCVATDSIDKISSVAINDATSRIPNEVLFKGIHIAIITLGRGSLSDAKNLLLNKSHNFKRIIVIFDEKQVGPLWFTPLHLVEYLGMEVTHNLLDPLQKVVKRLFDLALILLLAPFWILFCFAISILIKLDSAGPVFFTQKRIGSNGKELKIWKFRSMISNAEEELETFLARHPSLKSEWEQSFKLKNDPRVTRIGNILRRTSLDELPQIWNVLCGEMSLIGPRPIVEEEILLYGKEFEIYKQVLPGLTGMWQISGRNDLPYRERVNLDVYYIQNWSIWLDIHILLHTVLTVLERKGAY
jgi:Undecaprenyl-phosphate galactose phosphotransferase WbaP